MEQLFLYLVPFLGILGLVVMAVKSAWVTKQPTGDENMVELAGYIAKGAMSFLKAEWKVMGYFVVIAAIILGWSGTLLDNSSHCHRIHNRCCAFRICRIFRDENCD